MVMVRQYWQARAAVDAGKGVDLGGRPAIDEGNFDKGVANANNVLEVDDGM
jgi:hypothetical protein